MLYDKPANILPKNTTITKVMSNRRRLWTIFVGNRRQTKGMISFNSNNDKHANATAKPIGAIIATANEECCCCVAESYDGAEHCVEFDVDVATSLLMSSSF